MAFQQSLQKLGWAEGRNIRIDYRWAAGDADRLQTFAKEVIELHPDVILTHTTLAVATLRRETPTIPIVFVTLSDPIGSGFIASLAHPGGNNTGFINVDHTLGSKWLELVKEVAPGVKRAALLFNPDTAAAFYAAYLHPFETAGRSLLVETTAAPFRNKEEIESAIAALGREPAGALVVIPDIPTLVHRDLIIALAAQHRVPAIYPFRYFVASSGLMSYGVDPVEMHRRAAAYVDRILRGEKAADLPVQAPTKFELVINLKTAKALGLTVPPTLLARADEVIE